MTCTRCGYKKFGQVHISLKSPQGDTFERVVFECERCQAPRAEFLTNSDFLGHVTTLLENSILQWKAKELSDPRYAALRYSVLVQIYETWKTLLNMPKGADRAKIVHKWVDDAIQDCIDSDPQTAKDVKCKSGCSACCYTVVVVTTDEAELLADEVENGVDIDRELLAIQQEPGRDDKAWFTDELAHEDRRCVFLSDEGKCRVYANRPSACRKYFVMSDPEFCDFDIHPVHGVWNFVANNAEAVASAHLNTDTSKEIFFLPVALRKALEKRGKWT